MLAALKRRRPLLAGQREALQMIDEAIAAAEGTG